MAAMIAVSFALAAEGAIYQLQQMSQPQGIFSSQSAFYTSGTSVQTTNPPMSSTGYSFCYWTVNGVRATNIVGQSATVPTIIISQDTTAIAVYVPTTQDTNANGIADYLELFYYGTTTNSASADTDADGLNFATELTRGYDSLVPDTLPDGGMAMRLSEATAYRNAALTASYDIRSSPQGIISRQVGYTNLNTPVSTPLIAYGQDPSGYYFGYWTVNGVRQTSASGAALGRATLPMTNDEVAIAQFFTEADSNGNGLPDWYELYWFGNTNQSLSSILNGDGFTVAQDQQRGYSPVVPNIMVDGGMVMRLSDMAAFRDQTQRVGYDIRSNPQGIVTRQTGYTNINTPITTPLIAYGLDGSGYYFGYWTINDVYQASASGAALGRVTLPMTNDEVAVAHYFSPVDTNTNGLPDWYEWYWFGNTNQTTSSVLNGDGFTIAQDQQRGYSPVVPNIMADGGIMMRLSDSIAYRNQAQEVSYDIRSNPQGIVTRQMGYVTIGTPVTTPVLSYGLDASGYYFGYWTVNGARQASILGIAAASANLPMTNDEVAVAQYFTGSDANGNGLPDWYEWYWFGNTNQNASSILNGDGITILQDQQRGYTPTLPNIVAEGGLIMRVSDSATAVFPPQLRPGISNQPISLIVVPGTDAHFSTVANALAFQWLKNGQPLTDGGKIAGSTSTTLTVFNSQDADAALYSVIVSNVLGTLTSSNALLAIIDSQPASQTVNAGALTTLAISATSPSPLAFQWYKNGSPLSDNATIFGASTATLTISSALHVDQGPYSVMLNGGSANATSSTATLTVIGKAAASVLLGNLTQLYDGLPKPVSISTTPGGLTVNATYNGASTVPSAVGIYNVIATINDVNYQGGATNILTILSSTARLLAISANANSSVDTLWNGDTGVNYSLQWSATLSNPQWTTIGSIMPSSSAVAISDPAMSGSQRFYRLFSSQRASDIAGVVQISMLGSSDTFVSLPLMRPSAALELIESVSSNVMTIAGTTGWSANQFVYTQGTQSNSYYIRIVSGVSEGRIYPITANDSTTLTVNLGSDIGLNIATNDLVSIEPYWTLGSVFPNGNGINISPTFGNRNTEVLTPDFTNNGINLSAAKIYFFHAGIWKIVGQGNTDHSDDVIQPNTHFVVRHNVATNTTVNLAGLVASNKLNIALKTTSRNKQDNYIGLARPVPVSLNNSGLVTNGGFAASPLPGSRADELLVFDNSVAQKNKSSAFVYFYWNGAWRRVGSGSLDVGATQVFAPGTGVIIRKATNAVSPLWTNVATW